ncbi:MAG TPA: cation transporting ATPase C-terminal domain-containing protein [Marinobacter sp.]|nr:cation transporting ATPase C-terminal domain-containing protein [Marinobacter sp.]
MATLHHDDHGHARAYLKGAPERILDMCASEVLNDGSAVALDRPRWDGVVTAMASEGLRVLAIARQLGLRNPSRVVTGEQLDALDDAQLVALAREVDVFARTSPEHKLRLVGALQAASVVLLDDNFASIVAAVREGRTVYTNLRKSIAFMLPINGGESVSLIVALLLGLALPVSPLQILWVNMVSSVLLAMTLAFEPPESLGFAAVAGISVLVILELETALRRRFRSSPG